MKPVDASTDGNASTFVSTTQTAERRRKKLFDLGPTSTTKKCLIDDVEEDFFESYAHPAGRPPQTKQPINITDSLDAMEEVGRGMGDADKTEPRVHNGEGCDTEQATCGGKQA